jgi:hypothetical protein
MVTDGDRMIDYIEQTTGERPTSKMITFVDDLIDATIIIDVREPEILPATEIQHIIGELLKLERKHNFSSMTASRVRAAMLIHMVNDNQRLRGLIGQNFETRLAAFIKRHPESGGRKSGSKKYKNVTYYVKSRRNTKRNCSNRRRSP